MVSEGSGVAQSHFSPRKITLRYARSPVRLVPGNGKNNGSSHHRVQVHSCNFRGVCAGPPATKHDRPTGR
jgi:hypothetical protein